MNDSAVTPTVASKPDRTGRRTTLTCQDLGPYSPAEDREHGYPVNPKGAATGQRGLVMQTPEFHRYSHLDVRYLPPGDAPQTWAPGDFILVHSDSLSSRLIHLGQRFRIRGEDSRYTWFNHAALVVSDTGDLIEAVGTGVIRSNAEMYRHKHYNVLRTGADPGDVKDVLQFADCVADNRARYGMVVLASRGSPCWPARS